MNSLLIYAHHGSPGSPRDFLHLKLLLPELNFIFLDRVINIANNLTNESPTVQLGYSFGCVMAIISASKNPKTQKVLLIAPHIFPENKPGLILTSLLGIEFLAYKILTKAAAKKIEKMLVKSSHPYPVSDKYKEAAKEYLKIKRLKHAILEKNYDKKELTFALKNLQERNIPIVIIYGDQDQSSEYDQHIKPLLQLKNVNALKIENAGHALLWTNTEELAKTIKELLIANTLNKKQDSKFGYFESADKRNNVAAFLKDHKSKFPTRKILTWVSPDDLKKWDGNINTPLSHSSVSVAELDHLVGILAFEFKKIGIKYGDRVILFLPMSLNMYVSMFALQKMGAIPTFLDSWARRDQMGVSAKVANPTTMISAHRAFAYLGDLEEIKNIPIKIVAGEIPETVNYTARLELLLNGTIYEEECAVEKEHTALITFTTGSSGTPKGADRSHRFLAAQHYAIDRHLPYEENDKDLPVFPIFSLNNLAAGVETIIPAIDVGTPSKNDSLILYAQMKSAGVTCTTLSPSLFNGLSQFCIQNNLRLDFLKRIVTGGAPISRDDMERMKSVATRAEIQVLYGSTEAEPMAHIEAKEMLAEIPHKDPEIVEPGVNVGKLDSGLQYKFIDITKDSIFINTFDDWKKIEKNNGDVGELIVAGEHVCERYFNNEEAFFRAKIKDDKGVVWHRTGDLGMLDSQNNLWIVGRIHNAIKRKNEWFFPVRAEIILKKFPFVHKAAFLGAPDPQNPNDQKTFAVYSSLSSKGKNEEQQEEIRRVLEKNGFKVDEIVLVDDIPMDPRHHSKVEYDILRKTIQGK